jgi:hypothetical protein
MPASDAEAETSCFAQPFSRAEITAGSVALVAVVVVAFVGLHAPQPQDSSPSTLVAAAAPSNTSNAKIPTQPEVAGSVDRPPSEPQLPAPAPSNTSNAKIPTQPEVTGSVDRAPSEPQLPAPVWRPDDPVVANPTGPRVSTFAATEPPKEPAATEPLKETAAVALPPPDTDLNPQNPSDAIWMQARLGDLGYFSATRSGVWGPASRSALRDFKSMNGLQEDDHWDRETEQRLSSRQVIPAAKTFVGGWAQDINQCENARDRGAPIVISSRAARTAGGACDFRSVKREASALWRVQAVCTAGGYSWNANVKLQLSAPNLIWSSERGTATYVRCSKPELDGSGPVHHEAVRAPELAQVLRDFVSRIPIGANHP